MRTLLSVVVLICLIPYIGGASETVTYVTEVVVIPETIDTPVSTPIATLEQTPRIPTDTSEHKTPAITLTYTILVILLALHFCKKE